MNIGFSADIDRKIKKTSTKLNSYQKNYQNINRKMAETARAILEQKKELRKQNQFLKRLKSELEKKEKVYEENTKQLALLKKSQTSLTKKQEALEQELVFVIAKSVSLSIILDEAYAKNAESLVELEVLKAMLKESQEKVKKLSKTFFATTHDIEFLDKHARELQNSIKAIDAKRKKLLKTQEANKKALKKLQKAKKSYKRELKKLLREQNALKQTLSKLNIIKIDKQRKAQQERERKAAFARKKVNLNENLPKVKKHGSSYQALKTIKYRGRKTIAPLKHYTITKKYGTYTDPIYGIKIFNESISLQPKHKKAKVRTVFNGKVIYADKTAVLNNVVIIEHKNGLHTVYANLSQIAPGIRKGKKVKKGATIGRIEDELIFEVTQKSYHINPIRLFR
jgi:murein DD-endopeptidase MepM/ murein hydrolase activator NlpD